MKYPWRSKLKNVEDDLGGQIKEMKGRRESDKG